MEFLRSADQEELDKWLKEHHASYLQSSFWQRILLATGQKVEQVEWREDGKILAAALIVYKSLPFGWQYAFCPKGPVFVGQQSSEAYKLLLAYLRKKNCVFFRCEPEEKQVGLPVKLAREINPAATLILDIKPDAEQLLRAMHHKTRYNIRVAERKGLRISFEKNFQIFWELLQKTGVRDNFILHPKANYEKVLADESVHQITISTVDRQTITSGCFIGFGDRYYYLYGALDYEARQYMAPYLLQWTAIQQGKKLGYKYYDFFGVAPGVIKDGEYVYDHKHRYAGITKFKLGFRGTPQNAPGTFDLPIEEKKYSIYKVFRKFRRLLP